MNLKQLHHVVAVAETLNFSKAATKVHLCQSALSKSISTFENETGIQIFERTTGKVALTLAGERVVAHARHLLIEATNFRKDIEYLKTGALGSVSIGSGPFPAACYLDTAVAAFHKRQPRIPISLQVDNWRNLLIALHRGQIDFFIADASDMSDDASLEFTPVGGVTVAFCCDQHHPLAQGAPSRQVDPHDMLKYTLATVTLPTMMFLELKRSLGLGRNNTFAAMIESDNIHLLNKLVPDSDIILITSNQMMRRDLQSLGLVRLNVPMTRNRFGDWALISIKGRLMTPSANLLARQLITLFRENTQADDSRYGFAGNSPLNFVVERSRQPPPDH